MYICLSTDSSSAMPGYLVSRCVMDLPGHCRTSVPLHRRIPSSHPCVLCFVCLLRATSFETLPVDISPKVKADSHLTYIKLDSHPIAVFSPVPQSDHNFFPSLSIFFKALRLISTCIDLLIPASNPLYVPVTAVITNARHAWLQYGLPVCVKP